VVKELARELGYSSPSDARATEAIRLASGIVGTCRASDRVFLTWARTQGYPPERARKQAIQRLRQVFDRYSTGLNRKWGRVRREERFIRLSLRDAGLIPAGLGSVLHYLREPRTVRSPNPEERTAALERIADLADGERAGELMEFQDEAARRRAIDAARFAPDPWRWPED
jgi:hypothetical protein